MVTFNSLLAARRVARAYDWIRGVKCTGYATPDYRDETTPNILIAAQDRDGPFLVPKVGSGESYVIDALKASSLFHEFQALNVGSVEDAEASILAFASKYGQLGTGYQFGLLEHLDQGDSAYTRTGEPLAYWREQVARARTIHMMWEGINGRLGKPEIELQKLIFGGWSSGDWRRMIGPFFEIARDQPSFAGLPIRFFGRPILPPPEFYRADRTLLPPDIREFARFLVVSIVNEVIGAESQPVVTLEPRSTIYIRPRSLLGAIYVRFALNSIGGVNPIRVCQVCGKVIEYWRHPKVKYCEEHAMKAHNAQQYERRRQARKGKENTNE